MKFIGIQQEERKALTERYNQIIKEVGELSKA
jgi:hypothetical protein